MKLANNVTVPVPHRKLAMNKKDILNLNFDFKHKKSKGGAIRLVQITSCNGIKLDEQYASAITDFLRAINIDATSQLLKNKRKIRYIVSWVDNKVEQDQIIAVRESGNKKPAKKLAHKKQTKKEQKAYTALIKKKLIRQLKQQESLTEAIHEALRADEDAVNTTLALIHNILPVHLHNFLISIQAEYDKTDKHDVYKFDARYYDNDTYSFEEYYVLLDELQYIVDYADDNAGMVSYQRGDHEIDVHGNPDAVDIHYWSLTIVKYG